MRSNLLRKFEAASLTAANPVPAVPIGGSAIPNGYGGFHWDNFQVATKSALQALTPEWNQFGIGGNGLSMTIRYVRQKLRYFQPKSVFLGCFLSTGTPGTPAIDCTIRITPSAGSFKPTRVFSPAFKDFDFPVASLVCLSPNYAPLKNYSLPDGWSQAEQLSFAILPLASADISKIISLFPGVNLPGGQTLFEVDDLEYTSTLVPEGDRC